MPASTGALLINLGTPDAPTVAAVRRYLREFLMDPAVVDLPAPARFVLVHGILLRVRPKKSAHAYRQVWTEAGSPLLVHGFALRDAVRTQVAFPVELGMRYGSPSIRDGLVALQRQGVQRVVALPLYPQNANATTGSTEQVLAQETGKLRLDLRVIPPFHQRSGFVRAFAHRATGVIDALRPDHVLFSYHGLPERQIRKACPPGGVCLQSASCCDRLEKTNRDCYRAQCFQTTRDLLAALDWPADRASTTFQSRLGLARWTQPYTEQVLQELPAQGIRRLAVLSPAFVADCLETLEEIGMRGRETFLEAGGTAFELVPSLNAQEDWAEAVADWLAEAAG